MKKRAFKPQLYFSTCSPETISQKIITDTVKEMLIIAEKETGIKAKSMKVLDVGSGWGKYSFELEKYVKKVVGVEPYEKLYATAQKEKVKRKSKVIFYNTLIEDFVSDEQFDLVLSLTTIEHMPDVDASFSNIFKLLKKGGMIYVTAPNKLWPMEAHYALPFLGLLPLPLADRYLKVTGKGTSYEDSSYAKTYFGMKQLFNQFPCTYYFYLPSPDATFLGCGVNDNTIMTNMRNIGISLIRKHHIFWAISKGFIMIVKKKK